MLQLIERRNAARSDSNGHPERELHRQVRAAAKMDRREWINDMLKSGDWEQVRRLRKTPRVKQGRLQDLDGNLVESELRSETLAEYLEKVQWAVKFADLVPPSTELHPDAPPIETIPFRAAELRKVVTHLKNGRACG